MSIRTVIPEIELEILQALVRERELRDGPFSRGSR